MTDLGEQTATELAAAIRSKALGSRELLEHLLRRIDARNGELNAVVTFDIDRASAAAAAADEAVARGDQLGPLHGLPVTVKDALETAGVRSTGGAPELTDHVPTADADAVERIKAAGAIVFGKTNVPRFSGDNQTFNDVFGATCNPWDTSRSPGGSSGGPAVAVSCGFTSFELGTDIGGSIRMPAHYTGICGHKPSHGIVPSRGYLDYTEGGTTEADVNVVGPLARSVGDLELILDVISGPDRHRSPAWRLDLPEPVVRELRGLRVGVWLDEPMCPLDHEVRSLLGGVAELLAEHGAVIDDRTPPVSFAAGIDAFFSLIAAAVSPSMTPDLWEALVGMDAALPLAGFGDLAAAPGDVDVVMRMARGAAMRHRDWLAADVRREELRRQWGSWFEDHDVLLCPVTPTAALPLSDADAMTRTMVVNGETRPNAENMMWPGQIGVVYLPSTVVPIGRTASGLPVGVQVVGPFLGDRTTLRVAGWLADLTGGYQPPPPRSSALPPA